MRTSSYIIYVRLSDSNKFILMHGYSGAVDLVEESVVKFLKKNEGRNKNKLLREELISEDTKKILEKRGYLTDKTLKEE